MSIKKLLLAIVLLLGFSTSAHAEADFVKSAIQMGTSFCPNVSFECDNLSSQQKDILVAANECVASRFNMTDRVMSEFSSSGEYENCAISGSPFKNNKGVNVYAICCVKKDSSDGNCSMSCTRYIDQK